MNTIRDNFSPSCARPETTCDCQLHSYDIVSLNEVMKVLKLMKPKTCALDPIPTWIIKRLPCLFAPILCKIANTSLASGCFPSSEKSAVITPVLKKSKLDKCTLANYRPVSSLSFLSKFIERLFYHRLSN